MMDFILSVVIASLIGTALWIIQNIFKPLTQKLFSQTWHYYTGLIPVFFLMGGAEITKKLIGAAISALTAVDAGAILPGGTNAGEYLYLLNPEQMMAGSAFTNQLLTNLLQLKNRKEILLPVVFIWAAGAIVFLAVNIRKYRGFRRSVLESSRVYTGVRWCPAKVVISAEAATPMVMGFMKPVVVLPSIEFTEKELSVILSHELTHVKRGDLFVKFIILIAKTVHWFNPVVYLMGRQLNIMCELSCDENVVKKMNAEGRKYYGNTILYILDYGVMIKNIVNDACVSSLCNSKKIMKRRLTNIMNAKKTKKSILALSFAAAIGLTGIGAYAAYGAEPYAPETNIAYNEDSEYLLKGGSNVTIESADGKVTSYDKNGFAHRRIRDTG